MIERIEDMLPPEGTPGREEYLEALKSLPSLYEEADKLEDFAAKMEEVPMREAVKRPLNRWERRRQDKQLKALARSLEKGQFKGKKAADLTPEEQLAVKRRLLEKVMAANAEFDAMRAKEKTDE